MPRIALLLACLALIPAAEEARAPSQESLVPTAAQRDARLGWWREARFGMFIHWGPSAVLAGSWKGKTLGGYAEHIQRAAKISMAEYRAEAIDRFTAERFDAQSIVDAAAAAGMGYLVITAKHHDGFAMYPSQVSPYNITLTPFKRDPMAALRAACTKRGIRFGFYYSHAFDWGEADGPGNDWEYRNPGGDRLLGGADWWLTTPDFLPKARRYVDTKAIPQLQELIRNYDPDILWFDTPHKLPPEENLRILAAVRAAKPTLVVNGRLVRGAGDYLSTADRPAEFPPQDGDWEAIPTTNESYGYHAGDHSHKPPGVLIRTLAKAVARGGNLLLNIGPKGDGSVDPTDAAILARLGAWWAVNGVSIKGCGRTPLTAQAWGESTRQGSTLYLHVFQWPTDGRLVVGGLKTDVTAARLLADPSKTLACTRTGDDLVITVPTTAPDADDSVIALTCAGEPVGDPVRLLAGRGTDVLRAFDGVLKGGLRFGPGKTRDAWVTSWRAPAAQVTWPARINAAAKVEVRLTYDAPAAEKGAVVEGDAGREATHRTAGAGGTARVIVGDQTFLVPVRQGTQVTALAGTATLAPGPVTLRVEAAEITGQELFRLRSLTLTAVP